MELGTEDISECFGPRHDAAAAATAAREDSDAAAPSARRRRRLKLSDEERRARRRQANRESARRMRVKKSETIAELQKDLEAALNRNDRLAADNDRLRRRLREPGSAPEGEPTAAGAPQPVAPPSAEGRAEATVAQLPARAGDDRKSRSGAAPSRRKRRSATAQPAAGGPPAAVGAAPAPVLAPATDAAAVRLAAHGALASNAELCASWQPPPPLSRSVSAPAGAEGGPARPAPRGAWPGEGPPSKQRRVSIDASACSAPTHAAPPPALARTASAPAPHAAASSACETSWGRAGGGSAGGAAAAASAPGCGYGYGCGWGGDYASDGAGAGGEEDEEAEEELLLDPSALWPAARRGCAGLLPALLSDATAPRLAFASAGWAEDDDAARGAHAPPPQAPPLAQSAPRGVAAGADALDLLLNDWLGSPVFADGPAPGSFGRAPAPAQALGAPQPWCGGGGGGYAPMPREWVAAAAAAANSARAELDTAAAAAADAQCGGWAAMWAPLPPFAAPQGSDAGPNSGQSNLSASGQLWLA